jgi:DNA-binding MarR family transcriptional regulator
MQQTKERSQTTVPASINSPCAKLVYLYLSTHGATTVSELQDCLEMKKLTLYSVIRTLRDKGLVSETEGRFTVA